MPHAPLRATARTLPLAPGVYLFLDGRGTVLYVGKAKSLRRRVLQYFDTHRLEPAKRELMRRARAVKTVVTLTEAEALALEGSFIQQHHPPYNVRLVDDSSYLYVKITNETYPQVSLTRRVLPDGAWYRGPYPNSRAIRRTLKEARRMFPWCAYPHPAASKGRACFAYHLGLCPGICVGAVTVEDYQRTIHRLKRLLDGDTTQALRALREQMTSLSANEKFERAARVRDAIRAIATSTTAQDAVTPRDESADVIGLARHGTHASATVVHVRHGRVFSTQTFGLLHPPDEPAADILRGFLLQYYAQAQDGASAIVLPETVPDAAAVAQWIGQERGRRANISVARRGWKRKLLALARANAEEALARSLTELTSPASITKALEDIARVLHLPEPPRRLECYDISNIQGTLPTASMVVFMNGKPAPSEYRKFHLTLPEQPNDVAMMREVLSRRFSHLRTAREIKEWPLPDVILLDGGKGQLNAGRVVLTDLSIDRPMAALAKREEELFVPGTPHPLLLPRESPALYLLQRLRDEAHRFTLGYHRLLRKKRMTKSLLEDIPGVGDATRKKLLRAFGSPAGVRGAAAADLARVLASAKKAETIQRFLNASATPRHRRGGATAPPTP